MTAGARVVARVDGLLRLAADASGGEAAAVRAWGHTLLGITSRRSHVVGGGRSTLNHDGSPLQVCVSASRTGERVRLVVDPAWSVGAPETRVDVSRSIALAIVERAAPGLRGVVDTLIARLLAWPGVTADDFRHGLLWIGAGVESGDRSGADQTGDDRSGDARSGVAIYLDTHPLGDAAFEAMADGIRGALPHGARCGAAWREMLDALRPVITPASVGIEGTRIEDARVKAYWRLRTPQRLDTLGVPPLAHPAFATFLQRVVGSHRMRLSGAVFGAGFSLADGALADAKLDLCGHCLPYAPDEWVEVLAAAARDAGVPTPSIAGAVRERRCDVAFVGLGMDTRGQPRLNVYVKTPSRRIRADRAACARALRAGVRYLRDLQQHDGGWSDYRLPVGASTQWVTAFTGVALAGVREHAGDDRVSGWAWDGAVRAARWLEDARSHPAGWGFNERTDADADSTAFALRLCRAVGRAVRQTDVAWLMARWRDPSGFATFEGPEHWGDGHPCVTAPAFFALGAEERAAMRGALGRYLHHRERPDGTWPAYWWRTHYYSTFHHLILLRALGLSTSGGAPPESPPDGASAFDLAYAAGIANVRARDSDAARVLIERVLAAQQVDGGWPGGFNLRVTDPACAEPWTRPAGELYCDWHGTISTASVLMVLREVS